MNANPFKALLTALCFSVAGAISALPSSASAQQQEYEELTRGPVHEAFATSVSYEPEQGMIIDRQPPEMIEELPPDQRPEGDNVAWIPGYWAWDDDRTDFIWISGIWRNLPPSRQWIPGYWNPAGTQWQWISGYWGAEDNDEVTYLPAPPKALESGPNIDAPSSNHVWISGNWVYNDDRYAWRPGYWEPAQENWTWVPSHYVWTPRGYVYVDGYWDYDVNRRGLVFAPVHFERAIYSQPDYYYTPATVIITNVFLNHLFVRPRYSHYYFGDYYAPRYHDHGWFSSFNYHGSRRGYDPIYVHDRWRHRDDHGWEKRRRENFDFYRNNEAARPPRTWAEMMKRPENERRGRRDNFAFAEPLNRFVSDKADNRGMKFENLDKESRNRLMSRGQDLRKFSKDRQQLEVRRDRAEKSRESADTKQIFREKIQRSPFAGKRADQLQGNDLPPPRRERDVQRGPKNEKSPERTSPNGNRTPNGKQGPHMRNDRDPARNPVITPERKPEPGKPNGDRKIIPGERRKPEVLSPPKKQDERPSRVTPPNGMKRGDQPKVIPQPQRRPEPEKGIQRPTPPQERKITPERKIEIPRQERPPQKQNVPQRKIEPQRVPQAPQRRPEARPQVPQQNRPQQPQQNRPQPRPQQPQQNRPQQPQQMRPQQPQQNRPQARPQAPQREKAERGERGNGRGRD